MIVLRVVIGGRTLLANVPEVLYGIKRVTKIWRRLNENRRRAIDEIVDDFRTVVPVRRWLEL